MKDITIRGIVERIVEVCIYIRELTRPQIYHEFGNANTEASREQRGVIVEGWTR